MIRRYMEIDAWIIYKTSPKQPYHTIHDVLFCLDKVNVLCSSKGYFSYSSKAYRLKVNYESQKSKN